MLYITCNNPSNSVKGIQKELKIKKIKSSNSTYRGSPEHTVINWGCTEFYNHRIYRSNILNKPEHVMEASNKSLFFELQTKSKNPARLVKHTHSLKDVIQWLEEGYDVLARTLLRSHSGKGIVFITEDNINEYSNCKLFTQYSKKKDEYRLHFFHNDLILIQRKAIKLGEKPKDFRVRTHKAGYIFAIQDLNPPEDVIKQGELAFKNSHLDFGAVDLLWNEHYQEARVVEINTAPGLQGTTLERYCAKFGEYK